MSERALGSCCRECLTKAVVAVVCVTVWAREGHGERVLDGSDRAIACTCRIKQNIAMCLASLVTECRSQPHRACSALLAD